MSNRRMCQLVSSLLDPTQSLPGVSERWLYRFGESCLMLNNRCLAKHKAKHKICFAYVETTFDYLLGNFKDFISFFKLQLITIFCSYSVHLPSFSYFRWKLNRIQPCHHNMPSDTVSKERRSISKRAIFRAYVKEEDTNKQKYPHISTKQPASANSRRTLLCLDLWIRCILDDCSIHFMVCSMWLL